MAVLLRGLAHRCWVEVNVDVSLPLVGRGRGGGTQRFKLLAPLLRSRRTPTLIPPHKGEGVVLVAPRSTTHVQRYVLDPPLPDGEGVAERTEAG